MQAVLSGGLILRKRLFFFGSYEGDFLHQGNTNTVSVPTDNVRQGIMTSSANPIYDPSTGNPDGSGRTAFTGNIIPSSRISSIAQKGRRADSGAELAGRVKQLFCKYAELLQIRQDRHQSRLGGDGKAPYVCAL